MLIDKRRGKKKGIQGVTINIYNQYKRPVNSKSLTVHGLSVNQCYAKIRFLFKALESTKNNKITILVESEENG